MINHKLLSYCLILSTIILGANITSVHAQETKNSQQIKARQFINLTNKRESGYFLELQKFADNFKDLRLTPPSDSYKYQLNLLNNGTLVQTIATPDESTGLKTYIGGLSGNNRILNSILCASESSSKAITGQIKLVNGKLECPTGFKIVLAKVQLDALNAVGGINRGQLAYYFETSNFTKDLNYFVEITSSSSPYYDYKLDLLENGKLAQIKASPKLDKLKSFIGATLYLNGLYKSLVCTSNQPTKDIPQSIQLVNGKLQCPTGFETVLANVQQDALNAVGGINREQQVYYFDTSSFSKDINDFAGIISSSDTYYDYKIDILENGKLAQVKATSKLDNFKSFIGAIFYDNKSGSYKSLVCTSNQPTKDIPQSIQLVDGKLQCPSGFEM
jgi:hypothetical protein